MAKVGGDKAPGIAPGNAAGIAAGNRESDGAAAGGPDGGGLLEDVRLRLALDAAGMGTWEWWPETDAVVADKRVFAMLGLPPQDKAKGAELFANALEADRDAVRQAVADAMAEGGLFNHTFRIVRPDTGAMHWMAVRGAFAAGSDGKRDRLVGVAYDITRSRQAREALQRSEERFQLAMGAVSGLVYDWDIVNDVAYRSEGMYDVIGVRPDAALPSRHWWLSRIHPDDVDGVVPAFEAVLAGRDEYFTFEYRVRHEGGHWVHLWDQGRVLRDAAGRPVRAVGYRTDITERKEAEQRQLLLMAELDHRVKNILANVGAIARRTGQRNTSVAEFISSLEGRIRAMATAHSLLSAARWEGASLRLLVEEQLAPFASPTGDNIVFEGPDLLLTPKAAQSLALGLHELVTNAAKHGSLSSSGGRVRVSWAVREEASDPSVRLHWRELGGPPVAEPETKGFGLTVLQDMVAQDLGADVVCVFDPAGLDYVVTFACSNTVTDGKGASSQSPLPAWAVGSARATDGRLSDAAVGRGEARRPRRVLVVEDAWVVGLQLKTMLEVMGHEVVGPATTVDEALALAEMDGLEVAILDIRLDDAEAFPVADRLRERDIPFGFASGFSEEYNIPHRFRDAPRIAKPYTDGSVESLLETLLDQRRDGGSVRPDARPSSS